MNEKEFKELKEEHPGSVIYEEEKLHLTPHPTNPNQKKHGRFKRLSNLKENYNLYINR